MVGKVSDRKTEKYLNKYSVMSLLEKYRVLYHFIYKNDWKMVGELMKTWMGSGGIPLSATLFADLQFLNVGDVEQNGISYYKPYFPSKEMIEKLSGIMALYGGKININADIGFKPRKLSQAEYVSSSMRTRKKTEWRYRNNSLNLLALAVLEGKSNKYWKMLIEQGVNVLATLSMLRSYLVYGGENALKVRNFYDFVCGRYAKQSYLLHWFVENIRTREVVQWIRTLIKNGADVNMRDVFGCTPLMRAKSHYARYELEKCGAEEIEVGFGWLGDVDLVKKKIKRWGNVDVRDENGRTPLFFVCDFRVAKLLIERGADVNACDMFGETPLHHVHNEQIMKLLIRNGAQITESDISQYLFNATGSSSVKAWIKRGANANVRNEYGETPLHTVEEIGAAKALIDAGADVNARDDWGRSPLFVFVLFGEKWVRLLIENGADVNARDDWGQSPLFGVDDEDVARFLIKNGADLSVRDKDGKTAIEVLAERGLNLEIGIDKLVKAK